MESWERSLGKFMARWEGRRHLEGAIVCGSRVTGMANEHSDVDLHIVFNDKRNLREVGNEVVDGTLIEYSALPIRRIRYNFEFNYNKRRRHAATQFASGRILFDYNGEVARLRREAKKWIRKPMRKLTATEIESAKYDMWDQHDNFKAAADRQAPDLGYMYFNALRNVYEPYAAYLRQPVETPQRLIAIFTNDRMRRSHLREPFPDANFARRFARAACETDQKKMAGILGKLTRYVMERMGGFEIDGRIVRTRVDLPEYRRA
jgi:predicted nucleotidyltransferase